jgi:hypothetical protein
MARAKWLTTRLYMHVKGHGSGMQGRVFLSGVSSLVVSHFAYRDLEGDANAGGCSACIP